jgi:hypothetical protein
MYKGNARRLKLSSLIFETTKNENKLIISQIDCFFRKKYLSPTVLLASPKEEIAINSKPIEIKKNIKKRSGDFFTVD